VPAALHAAAQAQLRELVPREVADRARLAGQAKQGGIVEYDGDAIAGEPNIELDRGNSERDRTTKPGERVLLVEMRHAAVTDHQRLLLRSQKGVHHHLFSLA